MIPYLCPICKSPLLDQGKDAVCKNGHLFDRAKEGYFYLLPPKSNAPGDNAEMVRARRDFLDCGFYVPLARAITDEINALFQRPVTLLDAGNGILFVRNHRKKTKRQGRLRGNRHIQKCRKNLRKAQRARGVRRRKRVRRARPKRFCGRNRVRFFAVCNGRIHSDFEERRSVDFGISVRESPRSTEKSVIRKRTRRCNRTSRKFARTCRQKGNIIFV